MLYVVSSGGGQFPNVQITTSPNATVTLSKGSTTLTQTADSDGNALFESVEYGSWTATVTLDDTTVTDTIEVEETIQKEMPLGLALSSLPLKTTKLKIGGIKWILFARDHAGYPSGSQTLVSEYLIQLSAFGSNSNYVGSTVQGINNQTYENMGSHEKAYVLTTNRKAFNAQSTYSEFSEQVFLLNSAEVGLSEDTNMGTNIGFTDNASRVCVVEDVVNNYWWWLQDASSSSPWLVSAVSTDGAYGTQTSTISAIGVRQGINLSQNTLLNENPDSEGYYTIYRQVETANDLIVGDKVKIGGTKYIVKAKGHEGYPQNSVTLVSEYLVGTSVFGASPTPYYSTSTIKSLCEQYYTELSQAEKNAIVMTSRKVQEGNKYVDSQEHIFIMTSVEVGLKTDSQMGSNIGFTDNADRIAQLEESSPDIYWLADYISANGMSAYGVDYNGTLATKKYNYESGVRLALNLLPTAPIAAMDNTGYYSIQGADTETQLMAKALNILGVQKE